MNEYLTFPYVHCSKGVIKTNKTVSCDQCEHWVHIKCCYITTEVYNSMVKAGQSVSFMCNKCLFGSLIDPSVIFN